MLFLTQLLFLFFAEEAGHSAGGAATSADFYNTYLNYPGFEAWKFINFFVFAGVLVYLLRKPMSAAFKARRDTIRAELIKAQRERDAAQARLAEVEARLANVDAEAVAIREASRREADQEAARVAEQTAADLAKMRDTARREIAQMTQTARAELRRFSADESVKLAEQMLRQNLKPDDAARLARLSIEGLGGVQ